MQNHMHTAILVVLDEGYSPADVDRIKDAITRTAEETQRGKGAFVLPHQTSTKFNPEVGRVTINQQ